MSATATDRSDAAPGATSCLVCDGALRAAKRLPGLLRCERCGFVTADVRIDDDALRALYGPDYFHGHEYLDYRSEEASLKENFALRLTTLRALVPDLAGRDLLEIGCAYGFFLEVARSSVRSATGVDIADGAVASARERGLDARAGNYLEIDLGKRYGAAAMWDTIEHLARPDRFIAKLARDTTDGAYLAVTTGDIGSLNARWRGRRWRMIHPPTHLHYFSVETLTRLLERHGFEVVHASHPGVTRSIGSIAYIVLSLRLGLSRLYERIRSWRIMDRRLSLNLGDIMFVVARRKATTDGGFAT